MTAPQGQQPCFLYSCIFSIAQYPPWPMLGAQLSCLIPHSITSCPAAERDTGQVTVSRDGGPGTKEQQEEETSSLGCRKKVLVWVSGMKVEWRVKVEGGTVAPKLSLGWDWRGFLPG